MFDQHLLSCRFRVIAYEFTDASARPSAESCDVILTEAKRIVLAKKVCCAHIVLNRSDWLAG